ncbi:hypothetical protein [Sporosarcina sp. A2]|uniref:hypothetical protein n=1 Tax=Sporosarcina sp. A2 TaxID=3393449 RepID=UPI003D7BE4F6
MRKQVVTAVIRKNTGVMSILRTNKDSSILDQTLRTLEENGNGQRAIRVLIETPESEYIIKLDE